MNNHGGKFYNHGGLYPRVFRRLKPLGFNETPEVNTSVVPFTPTGVNVKLVHTAPGILQDVFVQGDLVNDGLST